MSLRILALLLAALAALCLCAAETGPPYPACDGVSERDALEALYFSTNGPLWIEGQDTWLVSPDVCQWEGVYCTVDNEVMGLYLPEFGMSGQLPAELGCLPHLQFLSLEDNKLVTPFIEELCQ
ncbi:hypothetical protein KIPB_002257, partial [Kipferlia bialata]|eukprot:g2257.t1